MPSLRNIALSPMISERHRHDAAMKLTSGRRQWLRGCGKIIITVMMSLGNFAPESHRGDRSRRRFFSYSIGRHNFYRRRYIGHFHYRAPQKCHFIIKRAAFNGPGFAQRLKHISQSPSIAVIPRRRRYICALGATGRRVILSFSKLAPLGAPMTVTSNTR